MTFDHAQPRDPATANIKVRPPFLFIVALLLGFSLQHILALPVIIPRDNGLVHKLIPGTLVVLGLALTVAGIRNFTRAQTPVRGAQPVRALVTTGLHGWSRNPIYLGMLVLYIGIGVAVRSTWILGLTPIIFVVLRVAVVAREEEYLQQRFGDSYDSYKAQVRRWL